jgi:hypothetical protein
MWKRSLIRAKRAVSEVSGKSMSLRSKMTAIEVIREVVQRERRLSLLRFGIYKAGDFVPLAPIVERRAKRLRRRFRLHGYWQSILTVCWADKAFKRVLSQAILSATRHAKSEGIVRAFELNRNEILDGALASCSMQLKGGESLFVSSKAQLSDGRWVHLPMMDFTCRDTSEDLRKVVLAVPALGLSKGVILRSGKSFHYYGFSMLTSDEWMTFLGKCLLLVPITDARYVAHRMIEGVCTLRISSGPGAAGIPVVAAIVK